MEPGNIEYVETPEVRTPPVILGQAVFLVRAGAWHQKHVPCPVCFGKRSVIVILGNETSETVLCDYCVKGFEGPSGTVIEYGAESRVETHIVSGFHYGRDGWEIFLERGHCERMIEGNLFFDKESAEARRIFLHAECKKQSQADFESQFESARRKITWTAGYHRNQIRDLEKKIAWHVAKLSTYKEEK